MRRLRALLRRRISAPRVTPPLSIRGLGDSSPTSQRETDSRSLIELLERAIDLAVDGKLDSSTHDLLVEEVDSQGSVEAMVLAADLALRLADYETALERATVVLQEEPGNVPTLRIAGDAALGIGEMDTAISYFTQALSIDKKRGRAFSSLAKAYLEAGEPERASHLYRRASREGMSKPGEIRNWHRAETLNAVDGHPQMVVEAALASRDEAPEALVPWYRLLVDQHPETDGLDERLEAAYTTSALPAFALLRAKHLLNIGEWESAFLCLQEVRRRAASNVQWYRLMRRALQSVPPGFEVTESMEEITHKGLEVALSDLEGSPNAPDTYLTLSRFCRDAETPEDARPFAQTPGKDQALDFAAAAVGLSSGQLEAELNVIDILIRQRRFSTAAWRADRVVVKWPDAPEAWAAASTARLAVGDVAGAVQAAHDGLARHPGYHACRTALVTAEFAANDRTRAAIHAMGIGVKTDIGSKRLRLDASLRVGDVQTALEERSSLSLDSNDAPTWLEDASETLGAYGSASRVLADYRVAHVTDGTERWQSSVLSDVDPSTAVFVVRGVTVPPANVLNAMAFHRRPHIGLVFTNWPHGAGQTPQGPCESSVVLAFAGDIRFAWDSSNRSIDATIEHLNRRLKSQFIALRPYAGLANDGMDD